MTKQHVKLCIDLPVSVSVLNVLFPKCECLFVFLQVLLFLQKEKEESPPEAQVNEENGENLKHCGHCQVLNGSNYTDPPPPPPPSPASPSPLYPPHLISPVTLYLPPRALSFSFSVLPGYWRAKGMLQSYWLHNRLLIPLSTKNKRTCITTGGLRKSKKAVTMKLEYRGVNMKKYCLKQLMYLASIQNAYCFNSSVDEGDPFEWKISAHLGNCFFFFFFFLPLVCVLGSR